MHFIIYLKYLLKKIFKQTWLNYYLINLFICFKKFYSNNQFKKTLINLYKKNKAFILYKVR